MQLSMTSLSNAVELMMTGREAETCGDRFAFVPPSRWTLEGGKAPSSIHAYSRTPVVRLHSRCCLRLHVKRWVW